MKTITIEIPDGKKAEWVNGVLTLVDDKPQGANEQIKSFEDAVRFLGIDELDDEEHLLYAQDFPIPIVATDEDINRKINAYAKLLTIGTAWNKIDGFEVDWDNYTTQRKHYPWFAYSADDEKFVFSNTYYVTIGKGSQFLFKTSERAEQFGKQFIDLWNELLK